MEHQAAVLTRSEEPIVVVCDTHTLNRTTMSLHFAQLLHWELPDLNGTWVAHFANTSKESLTVGQDLHL